MVVVPACPCFSLVRNRLPPSPIVQLCGYPGEAVSGLNVSRYVKKMFVITLCTLFVECFVSGGSQTWTPFGKQFAACVATIVNSQILAQRCSQRLIKDGIYGDLDMNMNMNMNKNKNMGWSCTMSDGTFGMHVSRTIQPPVRRRFNNVRLQTCRG